MPTFLTSGEAPTIVKPRKPLWPPPFVILAPLLRRFVFPLLHGPHGAPGLA
jgi:hypothetical protein